MDQINELLKNHGLLTVFLALLLEGIGFPVPAYPILIVAVAMVPVMNFSVFDIFTAAIIAALLPDILLYWAGHRYGTKIMGLMCRISITPDSCVRSSSDFFVRLGPACLFIIKFIPGFSHLGIILAGATRLRLWVFGLFDTIGTAIYIGVAVALGIVFRDTIEEVLHSLATVGRWGAIAIIGLFAVYLLQKLIQRKLLLRQLRMSRITVDELAALLEGENRPVILDVRPVDQRARDGAIPGSIYTEMSKLDIVVQNHATDNEVVVYCSCPNEVSAARMAQKLRKAGFKKIKPLMGGIDAWSRAGYPIEIIVDDSSLAA